MRHQIADRQPADGAQLPPPSPRMGTTSPRPVFAAEVSATSARRARNPLQHPIPADGVAAFACGVAFQAGEEDLAHEENILVADDPANFAAQIIRHHRDESLWNKLSRNGYKNIEEHFSFAAATRALSSLLAELHVLGSPRGRGRRTAGITSQSDR